MGNAFKELRQLNDAIKQYKIAISLNPNSAEALYNLGSAYKKRDEKEKALLFFEQAWSINSNMNFILGDLLTAKMNFCFWDNYHNLLSELKLKIKDNQKAVNPFNLLGFVDDLHLQMEAAKVFTNYQYPERYDLPLNSPYIKHPKIRIGYFSADFHNHATMHLMAELFELHDKSSFELFAFSFGPDQNDEWRQRASNRLMYLTEIFQKILYLGLNWDYLRQVLCSAALIIIIKLQFQPLLDGCESLKQLIIVFYGCLRIIV